MAEIRPVSDLREKTEVVLAEAQQHEDGIILTKNGYGHAVVLSYEAYKRRVFEEALYVKLVDAEIESATTKERYDASDVITEMRAIVRKHSDRNN